MVNFVFNSICKFVSRLSSWIPESFDIATFIPTFIDCFSLDIGFDVLLLSIFNDEILLANEIKSVSPIIVSGEGVSPS